MSFEDNPFDDRYQLDQCIDEIKRLKNLLADAERERDEVARDADILLGSEWRRSVQAVNGDPAAAREHRIAALVAELATATDRAEKAEKERDEAKFSPLGDNHHNAEKCPHCAPKRAEALQKAADARQAEIVAWLRKDAEAAWDDEQIPLTWAADAIERGEFRGKGGGDG